MKGLGWSAIVVERPDGAVEGHTVPEMDIAPHLLRGGECRCQPRECVDQPDCWTHSAFDDRDSYENGRKLH